MKKQFFSIKKPKWGLIALFMMFSCFFANTAMAQKTMTWTGATDTDWNTSANWSYTNFTTATTSFVLNATAITLSNPVPDGLTVGDKVGGNFPANTTVASIVSATSITVSAGASAAGSSIAFTFTTPKTGSVPTSADVATINTNVVVPVLPSGTISVLRLNLSNAIGTAAGPTLTINSGTTLNVNSTTTAVVTLNGGSIINNGILNITSTATGASNGITCATPSQAPVAATGYGYSGSGTLAIDISASTTANKAAMVVTSLNANTTYELLFNGTTTLNLGSSATTAYAIRAAGGLASSPLIIGGAGFTIGGAQGGLLSLGGQSNVTVNSGTTLTMNSQSTNISRGVTTFAQSAVVTTFINNGVINILGFSTVSGIGFSTGVLASAIPFSFTNAGTLNVDFNSSGIGHGALTLSNGGGAGAAGTLVNFINSGTLNLKNAATAVGSGYAIFCSSAGEVPPTTLTNTTTGTINLVGSVANIGSRMSIVNNGTLNSNNEFRSFTAITNNVGGIINFAKTAATATSKQVSFIVASTALASVGATYSDGTNTYTVVNAKFSFALPNPLTAGVLFGATIPATGTLTKLTGTGDATIAYTSFSTSPATSTLTSISTNSGTINTYSGTDIVNANTLAPNGTTSTSVIAPGGSGYGIVDFNYSSPVNLNGTLKLNVQGTTAGVDYDKVQNSPGYGQISIGQTTLDLTGIYIPTVPTVIDILTVGQDNPATPHDVDPVTGLPTGDETGWLYRSGTTGGFKEVIGTTGTGWSVGFVYADVATSKGGIAQLTYSPNPIVTQLSGDGSNTITQGCEGSTLTILGYKFTGTTGVTVNGVALTGVTVVSDTRIDAILPIGATSGLVAVTNASGTGSSADNFTVVVNSTNTTTVSSALSYTWANNGQTYTTSGTYTGTTTNCVTEVLNLTINAAFCVGATVGSATAGTDFKFYKDNKPTTAAFAGTQKLAATTYFISSTPAGLITDPRVAVTVTLTALVPAPALSSLESKNICKYIGTNNLVTFTAASSAATSHSWTVPLGAFISGPATGSSVQVNFFGANATPGAIGAVSVDAINSLGCPSGKPKLLALTTKAPKAPKSVVLTYNAVVIKKGGNFVGDASKILTLTAIDESGTADHHVWTLPVGTTVVTGDANNDLVLTVHLGGVAASNDPLLFSCASVAGCATSTKTLSVARAEAGTPKAITLTDSELPLVLKITKLDAYTGALKTRMLTLTATPNTKAGSEATSYKWVLPAQATTTATPVIGEANTYTSTLPTISVNLANVGAETSFAFQVYGVNGNGQSLLSKGLTCTSAAPKAPSAIYRGDTGSGTLFTTYSPSCGVVTLSVPSVLGVTYSFTTSTPGVVIGAVVGNSVSIDFTGAPSALKSTVVLTARATTGTGFAEKSFTVKLGACAGGKIAPEGVIADEFRVIAYPNPSSSEFTIEASSKGATNVQVYDMVGRLIENRQATSNSVQVGRNFATGVYNVIVSQGTQVKTLRVIKK